MGEGGSLQAQIFDGPCNEGLGGESGQTDSDDDEHRQVASPTGMEHRRDEGGEELAADDHLCAQQQAPCHSGRDRPAVAEHDDVGSQQDDGHDHRWGDEGGGAQPGDELPAVDRGEGELRRVQVLVEGEDHDGEGHPECE